MHGTRSFRAIGSRHVERNGGSTSSARVTQRVSDIFPTRNLASAMTLPRGLVPLGRPRAWYGACPGGGRLDSTRDPKDFNAHDFPPAPDHRDARRFVTNLTGPRTIGPPF